MDEISLLEEEWPENTVTRWTSLDRKGGVALVRDATTSPRILANIGLTNKPTAIITRDSLHEYNLPTVSETIHLTLRFRYFLDGKVVCSDKKKSW